MRMDWLQQLDVSIFRFINLTLRTEWLDAAMPFFHWNRAFVPLLVLLAVHILVKGGERGRIFVALLILSVALTDGVVCNPLKHAIDRLRPYKVIEDAHQLVRSSGHGSMPSSHAANWFAALTATFIFYRHSAWLLLPPALIVCFGRIYSGVHYPGDVLAGAFLGTATAWCTVWGADMFWRMLGPKYFPRASARLPSLLRPAPRESPSPRVRAP